MDTPEVEMDCIMTGYRFTDPTIKSGFPDTFLTERLSAERLRLAHRDLIHAMHLDPLQMAQLGGVRTDQQTEAYMERNLAHWDQYGFGLWLLRDQRSGQVAGRVLLRHLTLDGVDEVEVGYSLYPSFWGLGLAAEASRVCLDHAQDPLGLASVVALTRPENLRSQRVMTKIGMRYERALQHDNTPHVLFRTGG